MDFNFFIDGFLSPFWLIIGGIYLGSIIVILSRKHPKQNFFVPKLLQEVYKKQSYWYTGFLFLLLSITALFFILLAGPYKSFETQKDTRNGVDIEIVFDMSYSMIATDILPNRLEAAKEVLIGFIGELQNDRVGLILFAGKPFQSVPLTYDYPFLQRFIETITIETINQSYERLQGTAIGDALLLGSSVLLKEENTREKVIVFITDGEANKGIDPSLALTFLKEKNIKTYTIGVGKNEQTTITLPGLGGFPQKVLISGVDEELLKKIATETGGMYFRADSKNTFREIFSTIAQLEKKELELEIYSIKNPKNFEISVFLLGLFVLLLSFFYFKKIRF